MVTFRWIPLAARIARSILMPPEVEPEQPQISEQIMSTVMLSGGQVVVSLVAKPVVPTEIGRKIIDRAKVVLYNVGQISELARSEKETLSGSLRIALISAVSPVLVPGLFKYFGDTRSEEAHV